MKSRASGAKAQIVLPFDGTSELVRFSLIRGYELTPVPSRRDCKNMLFAVLEAEFC